MENKPLRISVCKSAYEHMFNSDKFSDIVFVLPSNIQLRAHKLVLAVHSEFLSTMFQSSMIESGAKSINIDEEDAKSFEVMIKFMYTGKIECLEEQLLDLLILSNKYEVAELRKACIDHCYQTMNMDNVFAYYVVADAIQGGQNSLKTEAIRFMASHFAHTISSTFFCDLPYESVRAILESSHLVVLAEQEVFEAIVRWIAQDKQTRLKYFAEMITNYVIIDAMNVEKLKQLVQATDQTLQCMTNVSFLQCLVASLFQRLSPTSIIMPTTTKRTVSSQYFILRGVPDIAAASYRWNNTGSPSILDFSVNANISIVGISAFCGAGKTSVAVAISVKQTGEVLVEQHELFQNTSMSICTVRFAKPITPAPGVKHSIRMTVQGPVSGSISNGRVIIPSNNNVTFTFSDSPSSTNGTDCQRGQIAEIYFYVSLQQPQA